MAARERFRATARRRVDVPVSVRTLASAHDLPANLVNLGLAGACLELGEALVPGSDLTLEVRTPTLWDPLELPGRVAWARWNASTEVARVGVHFEHHHPASLFSLFELLGSQDFDEP